MKAWLCAAGLAAGCLLSSGGWAQVQVLGVEVGTSSVKDVKAQAGKQTRVRELGTNKWSDGPMLGTDGEGYGIEGLSEVLYIFDKAGVLAGVVMTLNKNRFDELYGFLSGKYKPVSKQIPFVGDKFARFKAKGVTIELDAPHLSFKMSARYLRDDLLQQFNTQSEAESQQKKASERSKF